jgi:hypothetical protein
LVFFGFFGGFSKSWFSFGDWRLVIGFCVESK